LDAFFSGFILPSGFKVKVDAYFSYFGEMELIPFVK